MKLFCITLVELQRWLYIVDRNNLTERCEPTAVDEPATEHQQYIRLEVKQVCSCEEVFTLPIKSAKLLQ